MNKALDYPNGLSFLDIEVLRITNGEDVPGWCAGAAWNVCCTFLNKKGYLNANWSINEAGVALLKELGYA